MVFYNDTKTPSDRFKDRPYLKDKKTHKLRRCRNIGDKSE
jgi:hypothetical protein